MTPPSTPSDDWAALPVEPALSTLVDLVEIHHAGGPILDAGCGTGRVHEALMRRLVLRPHGYVGVDHTPTAVAQAAARYPAADFKVAERAALPFASPLSLFPGNRFSMSTSSEPCSDGKAWLGLSSIWA